MLHRNILRRVASCAVMLLICASCTQSGPEKAAQQKTAPLAEPLRICTGTTYSTLLIIAEQKGLFAQEGLKVELKQFAIGRDALEAMLAGNCDVATSADTPVADYGRKRDDLRVIAGIASSDRLCYIVTTKKSGIRKVADLKGRRVGVTKGTAPHFFLDLVLNKNRLTEKDTQLQFLKGEELHTAFRNGKLAAIATTDLNAFRLEEEFGGDVVLIGDPGIALNHGYLAVLDSTLGKKNQVLKRLLAAMKRAEQQVSSHPDEARALFAAYLNVSLLVADKVWESITPRLSLEQAMILTLEDNARWLQEREGIKGVNKSFRGIIRPELLQEVAPASVNL